MFKVIGLFKNTRQAGGGGGGGAAEYLGDLCDELGLLGLHGLCREKHTNKLVCKHSQINVHALCSRCDLQDSGWRR